MKSFSEIKHVNSSCHNYFTSNVAKSYVQNSEINLELCFFISGRWIGKKYGKKWSLRNQNHIYEKNFDLFLLFYHILSSKLSFSHKILHLNFYKHFDYFSFHCGKINIFENFRCQKVIYSRELSWNNHMYIEQFCLSFHAIWVAVFNTR